MRRGNLKRVTDGDVKRAELAVDNLTADERRRRDRWARWFERVMLLVLAALYVAGFHSQQQNADAIRLAVHTIQVNRYDTVKAACEDRNRLALGIQDFIARVAPDLTPLAKVKFHVEPNCSRYANVLLKTGEPPQ